MTRNTVISILPTREKVMMMNQETIIDLMKGKLRARSQEKVDSSPMTMIRQASIRRHLVIKALKKRTTLNQGASLRTGSLKTPLQINYTESIWTKWLSNNIGQCSIKRRANNQHSYQRT